MWKITIVFILFCFPAWAAESFTVKSARIVDGDTLAPLDAQGREQGPHVRLWGIDAPEMGTAYSWAAGAKLEAILRTGLPLRCERKGADRQGKDRHGRTVARCFTDKGADVALLLVRAGLARDWAYFSKGHYAAAERTARENWRGLWSSH